MKERERESSFPSHCKSNILSFNSFIMHISCNYTVNINMYLDNILKTNTSLLLFYSLRFNTKTLFVSFFFLLLLLNLRFPNTFLFKSYFDRVCYVSIFFSFFSLLICIFLYFLPAIYLYMFSSSIFHSPFFAFVGTSAI